MEGWIKLSRGLKQHWIWKSDNRLKWWIDILMSVSYINSNALIKGQLIECNRGQSIKSLDSWARDWNVSKCTVRDFFKLLEKDQMITTENIKITTRITVCNYDAYQSEVNAKKTRSKRKLNADKTETIPIIRKEEFKEPEEIKNKYFIAPTILEIKDYCLERKNRVQPELFFSHYESNGWMVGKTKMKSWKGAVRTWELNGINNNPKQPEKKEEPKLDPRFKIFNYKL